MSSPASIALGPSLIGVFLNIFLYGIMVAQCFMYYSKYQKDKLWVQALVLVLLLSDTINCVFDVWWIYDTLITNFGNFDALGRGNWVFATDPAMVGINATIVQLFFAWRVKVLTNKTWVVSAIVFTSFGSFIGSFATAAAVHWVPRFQDFQKVQGLVSLWLGSTAACDVAITIALTWHLQRHKTGVSETDDILNKIIRLTMSNGLVTALWALANLIAFLASSTGLHLVFNLPLAKLYTNSLMSSLNARAGLRDQTSENANSKSLSAIAARRAEVVSLPTGPEIFVHVESHEMTDAGKSGLGWSDESASRTSMKNPDKV